MPLIWNCIWSRIKPSRLIEKQWTGHKIDKQSDLDCKTQKPLHNLQVRMKKSSTTEMWVHHDIDKCMRAGLSHRKLHVVEDTLERNTHVVKLI